jgi:cytochrome c556
VDFVEDAFKGRRVDKLRADRQGRLTVKSAIKVGSNGVNGVNRAAAMWAVVAGLCVPGLVSAESATEKAIRARQSSYYLMGQQMARIGATLKGDVAFDKAALETSADAVDVIGRLVIDYFPAGSDQGSNTKAKAEIWKETPRFRQMAQAMQAESAKLKAAVHGGDLDAIKAAFGATAKSCKACHDAYRVQ